MRFGKYFYGMNYFFFLKFEKFFSLFSKKGCVSYKKFSKPKLNSKTNIFLNDLNRIKNEPYIRFIDESDNILKGNVRLFDRLIKINFDDQDVWIRDYETGKTVENVFFRDVNKSIKNIDIKHIWEIGRMQYLPVLAVAYRKTKNIVYFDKIKKILSSFMDNSSYKFGPHWMNSMEVGIRLSNLLLTYEVLFDTGIFGTISSYFIPLINSHYYFIRRHREDHHGVTNNHLLTGLASEVFYISKFKTFDRGSIKTIHYFLEEFNKQFLSDGTNYEGSSMYGLYSAIVSFLAINSLKIRGFDTGKSLERLEKIIEHIDALIQFDKTIFVFGDNDSGKIFNLLPNVHISVNFVLTAKKLMLEPVRNVIEDLFIRDDFCLYKSKSSNFNFFPVGKECVYNDYDVEFLLLNYNSGAFKLGGHQHNDLLSFQLNYKNCHFITDLGTGSYNKDISFRNMFKASQSHSSVYCGVEPYPLTNKKFTRVPEIKTVLSVDNQTKTIIGGFNHPNCGEILRKVQLNNKEIIIDNSVSSGSGLIMFVPLYPSVKILRASDKIVLISENNKIEIHSNCKFNILDSLYSPRYDEYIPTKTIKFISEKQKERISIKLL